MCAMRSDLDACASPVHTPVRRTPLRRALPQYCHRQEEIIPFCKRYHVTSLCVTRSPSPALLCREDKKLTEKKAKKSAAPTEASSASSSDATTSSPSSPPTAAPSAPTQPPAPASGDKKKAPHLIREVNGPQGAEPTRYVPTALAVVPVAESVVPGSCRFGDWEKSGRVTDF